MEDIIAYAWFIFDWSARIAGWLLAIWLMFMFVMMAVSRYIAVVHASLYSKPLLAHIMMPIIYGVLSLLLTFFFWRAMRFAAGYIGSSDYPFEHVVRFIQYLLSLLH